MSLATTAPTSPPLTIAQAWAVLDTVPDPEIPVLSLCDLGIVRDIVQRGAGLEVTLTPTYSGCPATEVIAESVKQALSNAGAPHVSLRTQLSPAWSTDWMSQAGREKLRQYGIAPPAACSTAADAAAWQPLHFQAENPACPHCQSHQSERISQFGSTACKALYRCLQCREPFDYFKPI